VLQETFFSRPTLTVARALLGCTITRGPVRLRIIETEGYLPTDSACHAHRGRTPRNAPMWGAPGHLYVYLCYGIHNLLNLVTEPEGQPAAVLIRGCVVLDGAEVVRQRRGGRIDLVGPGKVGQALGLDTSWSGRALGDGLKVEAGVTPERVVTGPRVGIGYADPQDRDAPWRFMMAPPFK